MPIILAAVVYNSIFGVAAFVGAYHYVFASISGDVLYFGGGTIIYICVSIVISAFLDFSVRRIGRVSWLFVLMLSLLFAVAEFPIFWIMLSIAYSKPNFTSLLFDIPVTGFVTYASWSTLHLCIRSAERAIAQERRMAALREAMLRYENEALSYTLDSSFFMDALMRIVRALNEEGGILAGEIVLSLAERMRAALGSREGPRETIEEASPAYAEGGEMAEARLRRLLLIGAVGVWVVFFCSSFLSEFIEGRHWWKSLGDYGGQAIVGALWFLVAGRFLQKMAACRVQVRCIIVFATCVLGICACTVSLLLSFALRGDLAWPPLAGWIFEFELNYVTPIFIGWGGLCLLIDARRREIARLNAAAEIREAALNARNAMLRLQLNPHFLFNTLNALYVLILDRQFERAGSMIAAVRRFLDRAGDPASGELVALSSELATQDAYLEIERVRFGDRLRIDRRIDAEVAGAKVPHLILQPLVENAVKYAVARTDLPVAVEICARRTGGELVLAVADTGAPEAAPRPPGLGVGLRNVEARLKGLYGEAGRLACRPLEPAGFLAEVRLPLSL